MKYKNHSTLPGTSTALHGIVCDSAALLGDADDESQVQAYEGHNDYVSGLSQHGAVTPKQAEDLMMSIEQRLQQWLGDDVGQRLVSAPPIRRSPMPAANLEPRRLARNVRVISRRLMAICGVTIQVLRRRSTSSGY